MSLNGYYSNGLNLENIFLLKTSGTNPKTGFSIGGSDLSNIFQPYDGSSVQANPTGYTFLDNGNRKDLSEIFQKTNYDITTYNPFSASTEETGYTYIIFNGTSTLTVSQQLNSVYIFIIGGGGGGAANFNSQGGGAGGNYATLSDISLLPGTYTITIGQGGQGGIAVTNNGDDGNTTSINFTNGTVNAIIASVLGGGGGSTSGTGGTSNTGHGGDKSIPVTNETGSNLTPPLENQAGYGNNGYEYTFEDGTKFMFGGGGGAGGGGGSGGSSIIYYGGGGVYGFYGDPSINFITPTGGNGGTGYSGVNTGDPGNTYFFEGITYNTGSGGGAGGNNDSFNVPGGDGCAGLAIIYYRPNSPAPTPPPTPPNFIVTGAASLQTNVVVDGYSYDYYITFDVSNNMTFTSYVTGLYVNFLVVGGGGNGGNNSKYTGIGPFVGPFVGAGGGGGGEILNDMFIAIQNNTYTIQVGGSASNSFISNIATALPGKNGESITNGSNNSAKGGNSGNGFSGGNGDEGGGGGGGGGGGAGGQGTNGGFGGAPYSFNGISYSGGGSGAGYSNGTTGTGPGGGGGGARNPSSSGGTRSGLPGTSGTVILYFNID